MLEITLHIDNEKAVSVKELNAVLDGVQIHKDATKFIISFQKGVESISLVFFAGLFLLHKDRHVVFHIKGNVYGHPDGFPRIFIDSKQQFAPKQYLSQIAAIYGPFKPDWIRLEGYDVDDETEPYQFFSPVLLVNKEMFEQLFKSGADGCFSEMKNRYIDSLNKHHNADESYYYDSFSKENPEKSHILSILREHPPIYSFVYCLVHAIDSPFVGNEKGLSDAKKRIKRLFQFTERYVSGLEELAKNIVEHSETGQGVIAIRAYHDDDGGKWDRSLETYVFDYGTIGIVPTLILGMDSDLPDEEDMEDLKMLNDNYTLEKFFTPGGTYRLTRQIRREMAHLGLLHFMLLIRSNNGLCRISTTRVDYERDSYGDEEMKDYQINHGTNFAFIMPISRRFSETGTMGTSQYASKESDELTLSEQALAAMPQIRFVGPIDQVKMKERFKKTDGPITVNSRSEEKEFYELIPFDSFKTHFVIIDFDGIKFSSTSLLRVLSMISERTDRNLIALNINSDVLVGMLSDNAEYMRIVNDGTIPYWIQDRAILVYSRMADKDYYFADFLYGGTENTFFGINRIVSSVFPNLVSIVSESEEENEVDSEDYCNEQPVRDFFYKRSLLPFDMLIMQDGANLFSHNLMTITNAPLN